MCGIIGAISERNVIPILTEGLRRLEYRGYDSAGVATLDKQSSDLICSRVVGKVSRLVDELGENPISGHAGIAHTRWATHGEPSIANAHPHASQESVAIVHNGIIENHAVLRDKVKQLGYDIHSETDSEVIAHLLHFYEQQYGDMRQALHQLSKQLEGAYALGIISKNTSDTIYALRHGSPLIVGLGIQENFIASDPIALIAATSRFIYLEDGDIAAISCDNVSIFNQANRKVTRNIEEFQTNEAAASKGKYRHFMLKEIYEQPQALLDTIDGHLANAQTLAASFGQAFGNNNTLQSMKRVQIIACGTSYHAALVGRYWLESVARIPCQVEVASENRYRNGVVEPNTLFIAMSQSGETADTLAALRVAKNNGYAATLGITNVAQSSLAREADMIFVTNAGAEIGVAATKTFTSQLVALLLLTSNFCCNNQQLTREIIDQINLLPNLAAHILKLDSEIKTLAKMFEDKLNTLFLGRGLMYPIALEGALKLKEISYMHAEAYPAGELKHGPLALVDKGVPVVVVAPNNVLVEKLESNMQEVLARGGELLVFGDKNIQWKPKQNEKLIAMPPMPELIAPIAYSIPLQLLAYHVAVLKGTDVDQPRNLAKSVTVE